MTKFYLFIYKHKKSYDRLCFVDGSSVILLWSSIRN